MERTFYQIWRRFERGRGVKSKGLGFEGTLTADLENLKTKWIKRR
jgi:hypothetical protein